MPIDQKGSGSRADGPNGDAREAAREGRLRYVSPSDPGFTRHRAGRGFFYRDGAGRLVRDAAVLGRIRSLAIPPAWTDVWICRWPNGHLQATGRDVRGRKQYRYHARFRRGRDRAKFNRMLAFAAALPRIRRRCARDLAKRGLPREKVLAAVVTLLEQTLIRVGNDEYARLNRSFGLTTMRGRHATVHGTAVTFRFRGKSGRLQEVGLRDRRLAAIVRRCQELPGQELFQYVDADGVAHDIGSADVNEYIRTASGDEFTAKDFRTWVGTVLAYRALRAGHPETTDTGVRHAVVEAVRVTAGHLGNTPAVARGSYVHPAVLEAYVDGAIPSMAGQPAEAEPGTRPILDRSEEAAVIALLRERVAAGGRGR